ncbi:MAG: TRAP transporter small permease subunit [Candidatus Zeuxoniibacter abyssi]|nr:MAG: TRAP transporter small permease subunit [Candidatus Persebacteraceae bacterium AB1(2)]
MSKEPTIDSASDELIAEGRSAIGKMPDDMPSWMAATINGIDKFSLLVGRIVCWMVVPLFCAMVIEIYLRYVHVAPTVWAYDVSRFLYGALFMLGAGYALSRGVHIRADFLYRLWKPRTQALVDASLYVIFYFPGLSFFLWSSCDFAWTSWRQGERGMDTAWMPYVAPIKTALPVGILFLLIQGVSELLKSVYAVIRGRWP